MKISEMSGEDLNVALTLAFGEREGERLYRYYDFVRAKLEYLQSPKYANVPISEHTLETAVSGYDNILVLGDHTVNRCRKLPNRLTVVGTLKLLVETYKISVWREYIAAPIGGKLALWFAGTEDDVLNGNTDKFVSGNSATVAAARCFAISRLGEEIDLP